MSRPHLPVLPNEILEAFSEKEIEIFVDGTLGAGGHAALFFQTHPELKKLIGIDRDPQALQLASDALHPWKDKLQLLQGNYSNLPTILQEQNISGVDGILLDLGVSSMQLDQPERGFSFAKDGPLDMRMGPDAEVSAREVVNKFTERKLGEIFRDYGEERKWRQAAKRIVEGRKEKQIQSTEDLVTLLLPIYGGKRGKIHPCTRIFQALRIYVNRELGHLEDFLSQVVSILNPEGRVAIISFHSLEDRIVKYAFRDLAKEKVGKIITKKPLIATREEQRENPRSRSAKLRVFEKN